MPTALVIGGSSDIGLAIARKFAEEGYNIQLTSRKEGSLDTTVSDIIIRFNVSCAAYTFQAENIVSHEYFFASLNPKPDIVIYVIGYMGSGNETIKSSAESAKIINANYTGAVSILNIVSSHFAVEKKGVIIGISSVAGERGRKNNLIYGSAKAGLTTYLSGLRNHLYPFNVHVITIKPGFVYTKMTEHLQLTTILTTTPKNVAHTVHKALVKNQNIVYVKGIWRFIMIVIRSIPEKIFKRLNL